MSTAKFGHVFGSVVWIPDMRLRASRRVRKRGESGKLPRIWMSLSVKSMAS